MLYLDWRFFPVFDQIDPTAAFGGAYNAAVGSYTAKLLPMGQRLEALKVTEHSNKQMDLLEAIDEAPRDLRDAD